jgi:2-(1,2-epoxy-1,2-dihydrophenyl)acetyl-CoA isomerase
MPTATEAAQRFYQALADRDGKALFDLLTDDFEGTVSAGMPHGVGGDHHGRVAMISDVWGRVASAYDLDIEPVEYLPVRGEDDRVVVVGRYRGSARDGSSTVDAAFTHIITAENGQITARQQITDTVRWHIPA